MGNLIFLLSYAIIAFFLTFFLIPRYIVFLHAHKFGKQIREEWLVWKATEFAKLHKKKEGIPSFGGGIILGVVFLLVGISVIAQQLSPFIQEFFGITIKYSLWNRNETYLAIGTLFTVWGIGLIDDYLNIHGIGRTKWLSARVKIVLLLMFAWVWAWWFYYKLGIQEISIPYFWVLPLGILYIPFFIFLVVGTANAVNFTDWLDGLAGGLLLFNYSVYAFICYDQKLLILATLCLIIAGSLIAFLWYNIHPAKFFMGDIGSLSLGATLVIMAAMTDTLIVLMIIGGIYIVEILSVIIQIISKRLRNWKKVFRIAPYHHHLEALWWYEETVVMRLWLVWIILSVAWLIVYLIMKYGIGN